MLSAWCKINVAISYQAGYRCQRELIILAKFQSISEELAGFLISSLNMEEATTKVYIYF